MTTFVASAHLLYAGMTGAIQNAVNKSPLKKKKKLACYNYFYFIGTITQSSEKSFYTQDQLT